jgi:hypothetical protein
MHEQNLLDIIAESENGYVSRCTCCLEYNVTFKNILLVFNEDAMFRFFDWLATYRSSRENYQPLPHGRNRVYSSPHSNLYLVYNDEELDELHQLSSEVRIVLEARMLTTINKTSSQN